MGYLLECVRKPLAAVGLMKPPRTKRPHQERRRPPGRIATGYVRGGGGSGHAAILGALEALVDAAEEIIARLPVAPDADPEKKGASLTGDVVDPPPDAPPDAGKENPGIAEDCA